MMPNMRRKSMRDYERERERNDWERRVRRQCGLYQGEKQDGDVLSLQQLLEEGRSDQYQLLEMNPEDYQDPNVSKLLREYIKESQQWE